MKDKILITIVIVITIGVISLISYGFFSTFDEKFLEQVLIDEVRESQLRLNEFYKRHPEIKGENDEI